MRLHDWSFTGLRTLTEVRRPPPPSTTCVCFVRTTVHSPVPRSKTKKTHETHTDFKRTILNFFVDYFKNGRRLGNGDRSRQKIEHSTSIRSFRIIFILSPSVPFVFLSPSFSLSNHHEQNYWHRRSLFRIKIVAPYWTNQNTFLSSKKKLLPRVKSYDTGSVIRPTKYTHWIN